VSASPGRLAKLFLRYAAPLVGLRRVPVLGRFVSSTAAKLLLSKSLGSMQATVN
jgi:hypothetical protein